MSTTMRKIAAFGLAAAVIALAAFAAVGVTVVLPNAAG